MIFDVRIKYELRKLEGVDFKKPENKLILSLREILSEQMRGDPKKPPDEKPIGRGIDFKMFYTPAQPDEKIYDNKLMEFHRDMGSFIRYISMFERVPNGTSLTGRIYISIYCVYISVPHTHTGRIYIYRSIIYIYMYYIRILSESVFCISKPTPTMNF